MSHTKSDTIKAMGIKAFLNERYSAQGGYDRFVELITAGKPDSEIAKGFSTEHRKINYQTAGNWRRAYLKQQEVK